MNWSGAVCAQTDPETWYPEKGGSSRVALAFCDTCPLRAPCLAEALRMGTHDGVWGGIPPRPRRLILKRFRDELPEDADAFAERVIMELDQLAMELDQLAGPEEESCAA